MYELNNLINIQIRYVCRKILDVEMSQILDDHMPSKAIENNRIVYYISVNTRNAIKNHVP